MLDLITRVDENILYRDEDLVDFDKYKSLNISMTSLLKGGMSSDVKECVEKVLSDVNCYVPYEDALTSSVTSVISVICGIEKTIKLPMSSSVIVASVEKLDQSLDREQFRMVYLIRAYGFQLFITTFPNPTEVELHKKNLHKYICSDTLNAVSTKSGKERDFLYAFVNESLVSGDGFEVLKGTFTHTDTVLKYTGVYGDCSVIVGLRVPCNDSRESQ